MREPARIDRIMTLIHQIWEKHPDLRLFQLMENLSWEYSKRHKDKYKEYSYSKWEDEHGTIVFKKDMAEVNLFHVEDESMEKFLLEYWEEINQ